MARQKVEVGSLPRHELETAEEAIARFQETVTRVEDWMGTVPGQGRRGDQRNIRAEIQDVRITLDWLKEAVENLNAKFIDVNERIDGLHPDTPPAGPFLRGEMTNEEYEALWDDFSPYPQEGEVE